MQECEHHAFFASRFPATSAVLWTCATPPVLRSAIPHDHRVQLTKVRRRSFLVAQVLPLLVRLVINDACRSARRRGRPPHPNSASEAPLSSGVHVFCYLLWSFRHTYRAERLKTMRQIGRHDLFRKLRDHKGEFPCLGHLHESKKSGKDGERKGITPRTTRYYPIFCSVWGRLREQSNAVTVRC